MKTFKDLKTYQKILVAAQLCTLWGSFLTMLAELLRLVEEGEMRKLEKGTHMRKDPFDHSQYHDHHNYFES